MCASISDAVEAGRPLIVGGIVDWVHIHRAAAETRTKRVDECLTGWADTGVLTGAASEDDVVSGQGCAAVVGALWAAAPKLASRTATQKRKRLIALAFH
jgi:hypothetical protein